MRGVFYKCIKDYKALKIGDKVEFKKDRVYVVRKRDGLWGGEKEYDVFAETIKKNYCYTTFYTDTEVTTAFGNAKFFDYFKLIEGEIANG